MDPKHLKALSRAVIRNSPKRVASLVAKHPELLEIVGVQYSENRPSGGYTALMAALQAGKRLPMAKALVAAGADVNRRGRENGATPLMLACQQGELATVRWLLSEGARVSDTSAGWGAFFWAASAGHEAIARLLIEHGADPNDGAEAVRTAFWPACRHGWMWLVELCLEGGADPQAKDNLRRTPLSLAAAGGHLEVLERLMDTPGMSAKVRNALLHHAVSSGNRTLVEFLIARGASLRSRSEDGKTLLHGACGAGLHWLVDDLLERGANPNAKDPYGNGCLTFAAEGDTALVARLLEAGAKVNGRNRTGWTALHEAAEKGRVEVLALLLEAGAQPNARDESWGTPLHVAMASDTHSATRIQKLVALLLRHGADPEALDAHGDSALGYASARSKLGKMLRAAAQER